MNSGSRGNSPLQQDDPGYRFPPKLAVGPNANSGADWPAAQGFSEEFD